MGEAVKRLCILCHKRSVYGKEPVCANCLLEKQLKGLGFAFKAEFRFNAHRLWRLDYYLPGPSVGIEIHGGTWQMGRHTRGKGFENDRRKMNAAEMGGIRVLEFTTNMVLRGEARAFLAEHLKP